MTSTGSANVNIIGKNSFYVSSGASAANVTITATAEL
jgi:hypothetical protein